MKTTIKEQMAAIKYVRDNLIMKDNKKMDEELKDAYSTLAALNMMVGNPEKFREELFKAILNSRTMSTTQDVINFLKSKGFPI